jgi:hypothetical protein
MFPAPAADSETIMLHAHTLNSMPSQVTVKFGDGAKSFLLAAGATLTELADCIGVFGAQHDGAPILIDIEFISPRVGSNT